MNPSITTKFIERHLDWFEGSFCYLTENLNFPIELIECTSSWIWDFDELSQHSKITPELIDGITLEALNRFNMGVVGTVKIAYQNFISTLEQKPLVRST